MAYASIAQLREYLPQVPVGAAKDAELTAVLDRAAAIIDGELGFSFAEYGVAADRDVQARGGDRLVLPAYQAGSVTAVALVSGRGTVDESTEAVTDFIADEDIRPFALFRLACWSAGSWYRVHAVWGYGPAPADVIEVNLESAVNIWRGRDASGWQTEVGVSGAGSVGFNRALTWAQRSILENVRRVYLGVVHA